MGTIDRSVWASYYYRTDDNRGTTAAYHKTYKKIYKCVRTRTGVSNPNWRKFIREHRQAGTALSGTYETIEASSHATQMAVTDTNMPHPSIRIYDVKGFTSAVSWNRIKHGADMSTGAAIDQANSRALKQIKSAQSKFSGSVFLGELREAAKMLRNPAAGLRKALKSQYLDKLQKRTKGFRSPKHDPDRWKKAISESWLEATFGWTPFLNDLKDAGEAYQEIQRKGDHLEKIKAVGKAATLSYENTTELAPVANFFHLWKEKEIQEAICVIRGEVRTQAATTPLEKAAVFGLSPSEFIPTVWELLPWSFLVDYFTNIGDILENSMTSTAGVAWLIRTTVLKRTYESTMRPEKKGENGHNTTALWVSGGPDRVKAIWRTVARTPNPSLTVPDLRFELPGLARQHFNMLALFTQATSIHPQSARKLRGRDISSLP